MPCIPICFLKKTACLKRSNKPEETAASKETMYINRLKWRFGTWVRPHLFRHVLFIVARGSHQTRFCAD